MRRLATLQSGRVPFAAVLLALALPVGAQTVVNVNDRLPAALAVDNPCTPAPEVITLTGDFLVQGQVVFNTDGTTHANLHITAHLSGADLAGVKYVSNDQVQVMALFPAGAQLTFTARFLVVSQTGIDNFHLTVRFRIGPDGKVTLDGLDGVDCRG
jgi:hypothetical protein